MLKVGLTGGIGSGKSTILQFFTELGVPTISADSVARQLLAPDSPILDKLRSSFGTAIVVDGHVDRAALRERVFNSPADRKWLEDLMHPLIYRAITAWLTCQQAPYCILEIPLLIETGQQGFVDRILVVDCPEELQKTRVIERDALDAATIDRILATQLSREDRLKWANDIILNNSDRGELARQINMLDRFYRIIPHSSTHDGATADQASKTTR